MYWSDRPDIHGYLCVYIQTVIHRPDTSNINLNKKTMPSSGRLSWKKMTFFSLIQRQWVKFPSLCWLHFLVYHVNSPRSISKDYDRVFHDGRLLRNAPSWCHHHSHFPDHPGWLAGPNQGSLGESRCSHWRILQSLKHRLSKKKKEYKGNLTSVSSIPNCSA